MGTDRDGIAAALPDYDVGEAIGAGESGTVWDGRHRQLHRRVAIKQLVTAASADQSARFRREARILAQLDHPHVVTVYDYREHEDLRLLVMAHLGGGTLADRRAKGMSTESAVAVALAAASGLHHVHQLGVLHRDVKPENLMFGTSDVLKVTDFGVARNDPVDATAVNLTHAGAFFGTPAYVSPEQAGAALGEGWPAVGEASDQYSLAAVLYEVLTGRLTHDPAGGAVALCTRRMHEDATPISDLLPALPEPVCDAVMRALERDPSNRHPSVECFGQALGAAASDSFGADWLDRSELPLRDVGPIAAAASGPVRAAPGPSGSAGAGGPPPSGPGGDDGRSHRGPRRLAMAAVVALVAVLVGVYYVAGRSGRDEGAIGATTLTTMAPADAADAAAGGAKVSADWVFKTAGQVYSSPAVADGLVVVGSDDASVYGIDAETGDQRWKRATGGPVKTSPVIADGIAYVGSYDGSLYAIDTATGEVRWSAPTGFKLVSSPAVGGGLVVVGAGKDLASFDAKTGKVGWTFATQGDIISSPAIADGVAVFGSSDHAVYAVSLTDGKERWHLTTGDKVLSSPVIEGSTAYIGGRDGYLYAIDIPSGHNPWAVDLGSPVWSSPAVDGTSVFVGTDGGTVEAVDIEEGARRWTGRTADRIESSPSVAGTWLGVGSNDGRLHVFGVEGGTPSGSFETEGPVLSSPAAVDGSFVVGSYDGNVYRVSVAAPNDD